MIEALLENYGDVGWAGIIIIAMVWYFWYQTKCQADRDKKHEIVQKEERMFYRSLVTEDLKELHQDNVTNIKLNEKMSENLTLHNKTSVEFSEKVLKAFDIVAHRLNGGTAGTKAIKKLKELEEKDRRQKNKKVDVDRRKND